MNAAKQMIKVNIECQSCVAYIYSVTEKEREREIKSIQCELVFQSSFEIFN